MSWAAADPNDNVILLRVQCQSQRHQHRQPVGLDSLGYRPRQRFVHHFPHLQRLDQRARVSLPPARGERQRRQRGRARFRAALVREGSSQRPACRAHRPCCQRGRRQRYPDMERPGRRFHHPLRVQCQPQRHRHGQPDGLERLGKPFPAAARPPHPTHSAASRAGGSTATTCGR